MEPFFVIKSFFRLQQNRTQRTQSSTELTEKKKLNALSQREVGLAIQVYLDLDYLNLPTVAEPQW